MLEEAGGEFIFLNVSAALAFPHAYTIIPTNFSSIMSSDKSSYEPQKNWAPTSGQVPRSPPSPMTDDMRSSQTANASTRT